MHALKGDAVRLVLARNQRQLTSGIVGLHVAASQVLIKQIDRLRGTTNENLVRILRK